MIKLSFVICGEELRIEIESSNVPVVVQHEQPKKLPTPTPDKSVLFLESNQSIQNENKPVMVTPRKRNRVPTGRPPGRPRRATPEDFKTKEEKEETPNPQLVS